MKFSILSLPVGLIFGVLCIAESQLERYVGSSLAGIQKASLLIMVHSSLKERSTGLCSLGIGRQQGTISWDVTVYNVPQAQRQDANIIATVRNTGMDEGQSINITALSEPITITNINNAPVFDYDNHDLNNSIVALLTTGVTKVELQFEMPSAGLKWTTSNCTAGSVVISAGRESWSCDFACAAAVGSKLKEL